ncbi:MAG: inner membrane CreD family protein [Acidobacteriota bacterium]
MSKKIAGIIAVFLMASAGWMILGSSISVRTSQQDDRLRQAVGELWGTPLQQRAPDTYVLVERPATEEKWDEVKKAWVKHTCVDKHAIPVIQSRVRLDIHLDQRRKGLLWYSTYRVKFAGKYVFQNTTGRPDDVEILFAFPAPNGIYDDFVFTVDDAATPFERVGGDKVLARVPTEVEARHTLSVAYVSQGLDTFTYRFADGIGEVRDFSLVMTTDFDGFDFPGNTMSPTVKNRKADGWELAWTYKNLISGNGIGLQMPKKINPGPMAARISFFAPVSLGFFFFLIFIVCVLKRVDVHPMNYFFLAAAFFAFHLLLAYLVDHISIHAAFAICSAVSLFLVVSYMRLVVGTRFAFVETALSQLVYLVGFSYAFFFEGFTGLAVTVGAIVTLFVVMQLTARIDWSAR